MDMLFALPVEVRRCRRNPKRLVVVSATGEVLLRTLTDKMRCQNVAERFVRSMNEWAAADVKRLEQFRFGLSHLESETAVTDDPHRQHSALVNQKEGNPCA